MDPTDNDEVINVTIDHHILESYKKPKAGNDLIKGCYSVSGVSLSFDELKPVIEDISNSIDSNKVKELEIPIKDSASDEFETTKNVQKSFDYNITEPLVVDENLNTLFSDLKISNEEKNSDSSQLIERGPDRLIKYNYRPHSIYDRCSSTEIKEKLRFLSGSTVLEASNDSSLDNLLNDAFSNTISINEVCVAEKPDPVLQQFISKAASFNPPTTVSNANDLVLTNIDSLESSSSNQFSGLFPTHNSDSFYEDVTVVASSSNGSVSSGYETCSPHSFSCSPPKLNFPYSNSCDEVFVKIIDEEEVLNSVVELESLTNCIPDPVNVSSTNLSEQSQKENIINYLKEGQKENIINYLKEGQKDKLKSNCFLETIQEPSVQSTVEYDGFENLIQFNSLDISKNSNVPTLIKASDLAKAIVSKSKKCPAPKIGAKKDSLSSNNLPAPKPLIACKPSDNVAKDRLRRSLSPATFYEAQDKVYRDWMERKKNLNDESAKFIYVENPDDKFSKMQTNLHLAVLNSEPAKILCLIEGQKQMIGEISEINNRDKDLKTALDYAIEKKMTLIVDYLKENNASPSTKV